MTKRLERVNSLIRELASRFFLTEIKIKDTIITVIRVKTSSDLKYVKIFMTIFPEKKEGELLKKILEKKSDWQKFFASKFQAKFLPRTEFLIDEEEKSAMRMEELLGKTNKA